MFGFAATASQSSHRCVYSIAGMSYRRDSAPSFGRPPFNGHNSASSRRILGLSSAPSISTPLFPRLFILFTALFITVNSAVVGVDQPIKAPGGIPGPPAHKPPKKEDQEKPFASTADLSTIAFIT